MPPLPATGTVVAPCTPASVDHDVTTTILSVAVLGFMATRLVGGVRVSRSEGGRLLVRQVVSRLRWRHVWPVPIVPAVVLVAAGLLVQVPLLHWGWWSAIGGDGNVRTTGSRRDATLESATAHTAYNGVIICVVLVALVLTSLP